MGIIANYSYTGMIATYYFQFFRTKEDPQIAILVKNYAVMELLKRTKQYWTKKRLRRIARKITQEYGTKIDRFQIENDVTIEFANWQNPLVKPHTLSQAEIDFFKLFINKGDLSIDIGANIGVTTVPIAIATGNTGITLAFDPNPLVFKILGLNAKLNPEQTNIIPHCKAITKYDTDFYYISSEASFANGGISETQKSIHGNFIFPEKIFGINLASFLHKNYNDNIKNLSFIKIDAEGHDVEIIKSIQDILVNQKPTIIAESFGPATKKAKQELFDIINDSYYSIYYTSDLNINATFKRIKSRDDLASYSETINIIAVSNSNSKQLNKLHWFM